MVYFNNIYNFFNSNYIYNLLKNQIDKERSKSV